MIVITGAAGFIGSCLLSFFNTKGREDIILCDEFGTEAKNKNLAGKKYIRKIERDVFFEEAEDFASEIEAIFHLGARTDTTEFDQTIFDRLNLNYSKTMWKFCHRHQIPLIYASSAATYGGGEMGYDDKESLIPFLKPLNPYGESKNNFDIWALDQTEKPPYWAALKFFNIYGPNEYHKARMASVILHAFRQISDSGKMKLFRSHRPDFRDGEQKRDFVYVKDVCKVCLFLFEKRPRPGIYNLGTGQARTFKNLAEHTFRASGKEPNIDFVDTPEDIRDKYQYFTQAEMSKLQQAGYTEPFTDLREGIEDYVKNYLLPNKYL